MSLTSKLCKLLLLAGLFLIPAVRQVQAATCPAGCGYKWNPATQCCEPDPRFDCVEFCF